MARLFALLLAVLVAAGCGKKKPADAPAPAVEEPAVPAVPVPDTPPPTDVAKQLKLLKVNKADVQQAAAAALAAVVETDPAVIPALVELLADKTGLAVGRGTIAGPNSVREAVVLTLVLSGPKGEKAAVENALPVLIAALADANEMIRCNAASAVGRLGAKAAPAVEKLWPLASEPSAPVREAALRALIDIGTVPPGPLCKLLAHADEGVRVTAAENLQYFRGISAEAVNDLVTAVADAKVRVRLAAADALATLGAKAAPAVPALLKALAANSPTDRIDPDEFAVAALNAVVAVGEPAVPAVAKFLTDGNPVMRFLAAHMLGEIGPPAKSAADALEKLLADRVPEVAGEAARALVVVTGSINKVEAPVEAALKEGNADNRRGVLQLIGRMGAAGKPFAAVALPLLDDPDSAVRAAALEFVATLDAATAKPAIPKVAKLLADDEANTRVQAANVLLALGRAAVPVADALAKAVAGDTDDRVRLTALDALAALGPDGKVAVPELVKVIGDGSAPSAVRVKALAVAPALAPADADLAKAVAKALADKTETVREAAAFALPALADPPAEALKKLGELIATDKTYAGRTTAVRAAAALGPKAAALKDKLTAASASEVRDHANWGKIALACVEGKTGEVDLLVRGGLASKWPAERNAALTALAGLVAPKVADAVAVLAASKERSAVTRHAAAVVLARIPDSPDAVTRLTELLKDADPDVKLVAIRGLETLGPKATAASKALREVANGKDDTARAARKALRAVEGKTE